MGLNHYRFRSVWELDAPPDAVYAVLERAGEYPEWWPQVREVRWRDGDGDGAGGGGTGTARFRSLLPYDLRVTARQTYRDPGARVLAVSMAGDLEGWARWRLVPRGVDGGTRAVFEQEVEVRKPLLRVLALPGRPLFAANHALMMRAGRRGLCRRLADGPGRSGPADGRGGPGGGTRGRSRG
ncbi:MAG TPA: SRPBCC family protein [Streptomyces sp.]|uniref:SRPBCC family protein n=1 Tax=Streptomyces sp. TaxID=1931 RepID=UPI002D4866D5|nr:SRPBCC family protein [Streptomyces sp.]HZG06625.1 SRPBCC family protein [Streptomyces sp.]